MKFAVISNVQGNVHALRAVLADVDSMGRQIDTVVSAGDLIGLGPSPNDVIDLIRERGIESTMGNYDEAIALDRSESGTDFATQREEVADSQAIAWTRAGLTPANLHFVQALPRDLRLSPGGAGTQVTRNRADERSAEYKRTFLFRAMFGGMFRMPVTGSKRVLVFHGSPRAINELIREDSANSILGGIARETQADVLVTGHAGTAFRREAHGITFIGAGSVSGSAVPPGLATYVVVGTGERVETDFREVRYDDADYRRAIAESGMPAAGTRAAG